MLKERPTEPFWFVSKDDEAMYTVDTGVIGKYLLSRDINILPIDMDSKTINGISVTMFKCLPLSRKAARILETSASAAIDTIVQTHITEVVNFEGGECVRKQDGTFMLSDKSMELLDDGIINELGTVIIEKGQGRDGETKAFSSPDGWLRGRLASLQLPAVAALVDGVMSSSSDQSPGKAEHR